MRSLACCLCPDVQNGVSMLEVSGIWEFCCVWSIGKKTRAMGWKSLRDMGNPFCTKSAKVQYSSSVAAATILSHYYWGRFLIIIGVAFVHRRKSRFNNTVDRLGWVNHNSLKRLMYRVLLRLCCWNAIIFSDRVPAGYREAQLGAALSFPGRYLIRNSYY